MEAHKRLEDRTMTAWAKGNSRGGSEVSTAARAPCSVSAKLPLGEGPGHHTSKYWHILISTAPKGRPGPCWPGEAVRAGTASQEWKCGAPGLGPILSQPSKWPLAHSFSPASTLLTCKMRGSTTRLPGSVYTEDSQYKHPLLSHKGQRLCSETYSVFCDPSDSSCQTHEQEPHPKSPF